MGSRSFRGRLFVLEGPDGVGKTTICGALAQQLQSRGHDLLLLSFPGKQPGSLGELVYRVHHDEGPLRIGDMSMLAKQALHVAAHIDAIDRQILPALEEGKVVLLDRYWWSAWVYGLVGGCSRRKLRALVEAERAAWGRVRPALAVLLRRPTPIDRDDPPVRWQRLSDEYARLAEREGRLHPVAVIDNVGKPTVALAAPLGLTRQECRTHVARAIAVRNPGTKSPYSIECDQPHPAPEAVCRVRHVLALRRRKAGDLLSAT